MTFRQGREALRRKLNSRGGFTLTELLTTTMILLLVTSVLVTGVALAAGQYQKSMVLSGSKVLASTLTSVIQSELASTGTAVPGAKISGSEHALDGFFSMTYANTRDLSRFYAVEVGEAGISVSEDGYGELMLGTIKNGKMIGNLLISSSAYSSCDLKAKAEVTCKLSADGTEITLFHVVLHILSPSGEEMTNAFDVLPLNHVSADTGD